MQNNVPPLTVFEFKFNDEELEQAFHNFFYRNNLIAIFTDEHQASPISVSYADARSVVREKGKSLTGKDVSVRDKSTLAKENGASVGPLIELSEMLSLASDNKMYQEAMFRTIEEPRTFQGFMNYVKKLTQYIKTTVEDRHMHNIWNIVWYNKDLT